MKIKKTAADCELVEIDRHIEVSDGFVTGLIIFQMIPKSEKLFPANAIEVQA